MPDGARRARRCRRSQHMRAEARLAVDEVAEPTTASAVQKISDGTPNRLPAPKKPVKVASVTGTECRSVSQRATPASRPIVASVTRNDGSRR